MVHHSLPPICPGGCSSLRDRSQQPPRLAHHRGRLGTDRLIQRRKWNVGLCFLLMIITDNDLDYWRFSGWRNRGAKLLQYGVHLRSHAVDRSDWGQVGAGDYTAHCMCNTCPLWGVHTIRKGVSVAHSFQISVLCSATVQGKAVVLTGQFHGWWPVLPHGVSNEDISETWRL